MCTSGKKSHFTDQLSGKSKCWHRTFLQTRDMLKCYVSSCRNLTFTLLNIKIVSCDQRCNHGQDQSVLRLGGTRPRLWGIETNSRSSPRQDKTKTSGSPTIDLVFNEQFLREHSLSTFDHQPDRIQLRCWLTEMLKHCWSVVVFITYRYNCGHAWFCN